MYLIKRWGIVYNPVRWQQMVLHDLYVFTLPFNHIQDDPKFQNALQVKDDFEVYWESLSEKIFNSFTLKDKDISLPLDDLDPDVIFTMTWPTILVPCVNIIQRIYSILKLHQHSQMCHICCCLCVILTWGVYKVTLIHSQLIYKIWNLNLWYWVWLKHGYKIPIVIYIIYMGIVLLKITDRKGLGWGWYLPK